MSQFNILRVLLLGSVPKGDEERNKEASWRLEWGRQIKAAIPEANFIHNDVLSDAVGPELIVGHDLWLVKHADVILVNASEKAGAGTAQEMIIAKYFQKPVVSVIPKNSHYRRSNIVFDGEKIDEWIHPFLFVASDTIVETVDEAIAWLQKDRSSFQVKDFAVYNQLIEQFETKLPDILEKYRKQGW